MKKCIASLIFILISQLGFGIVYEEYFIDKGLRVDLIHSGNHRSEQYHFYRIKAVPAWGGPRKNLISPLNLGSHRISLVDPDSKMVIFRKGFNCLFGEWQTVDEAKTINRAFEESFILPYPGRVGEDGVTLPVLLMIEKRDKKNRFRKIYDILLDFKKFVVEKTHEYTFKTKNIHISGDFRQRLDLLLISEGYTQDQKEKFFADAEMMKNTLFTVAPFKELKKKINIRAVMVPSKEISADIPSEKIFRKTPFHTTYDTFWLNRYLNTFRYFSVIDVASLYPFDSFVILVNSKKYGGSGIYNHYSLVAVDANFGDYVFIHEIGHSLAGLGDEYFSSKVAYNDFYPKGVEPWEPNLTALKKKRRLKWSHLVDPGIPIPTPDKEEFRDKLGAFEGGGYTAKGIFRPSNYCIMYTKALQDFCPVCSEAIIRVVNYYCGSE